MIPKNELRFSSAWEQELSARGNQVPLENSLATDNSTQNLLLQSIAFFTECQGC